MISEELKQLFASEAVQKVTIYTDIPGGTGTETRIIENTPTAVFKNGTANPIIGLRVGVNAQFQGTISVGSPGHFIGRSSTTISINGTGATATYGQTAYKGEYGISGRLEVTHDLIIYNGSEEWTTYNNRYCVPLDTAYRKSQDPASNMWSARMINTLGSDYSLLAMPLALTEQMTLEQWQTYLSAHNLEVLLERVTPTIYMAPSLTLSTVFGENTISADTGDIIYLAYTAQKSKVITEADIMSGTFTINRSAMSGSSLTLGACISSELSMTLINYDGRFDGVSWSGAELSVVLGVEGSDETLPMGVFYVDGTPKSRDTIALTALDGMTKFDRLIRDVGAWWGPITTLKDIVERCCLVCGVTLATDVTDFPNSDWYPYQQIYSGYTYRQLLSFAVALMGKCAWMDENGQLRIGFAEKLSGFEHSAVVGIAVVGQAIVGNSSGSGLITDAFGRDKRFSSDYEDTSITITGITYTRDDTVYTVGTDDYAFDLTNNPLLDYADYGSAPSYTEILPNLIDLVGLKYTPVVMTVVPCPHIFPFDWVTYALGDNSNIFVLVTDYTFVMNGANQIASRGESPTEKVNAALTQSVNYVQNVVKATDDFILASGVSANEGWVAYKSGVLKCWKRVTDTVDCTEAWGTLYDGSTSAISFPSMGNYSFIEAPCLHISGQAYNGGAWLVPATTTSLTGTGTLWWLRPTSASNIAVTINIEATGRWKE